MCSLLYISAVCSQTHSPTYWDGSVSLEHVFNLLLLFPLELNLSAACDVDNNTLGVRVCSSLCLVFLTQTLWVTDTLTSTFMKICSLHWTAGMSSEFDDLPDELRIYYFQLQKVLASKGSFPQGRNVLSQLQSARDWGCEFSGLKFRLIMFDPSRYILMFCTDTALNVLPFYSITETPKIYFIDVMCLLNKASCRFMIYCWLIICHFLETKNKSLLNDTFGWDAFIVFQRVKISF